MAEKNDEQNLADRDYSEQQLVAMARAGRKDAWEELVRRHRKKALQWANTITRDAHLAEDIVQEALIRVFLHMGSLVDVNRFEAWFRRIVRNQAMRNMGRGAYRRERPVSDWRLNSESEERFVWGNLDEMLDYLSHRSTSSAKTAADPADLVTGREVGELINMIMSSLSRREKQIVEAHFFRQMTPEEIADSLVTSRDNVYKQLSRARQKMQQEHLRLHPPAWLLRQKELFALGKKVLDKPDLGRMKHMSPLIDCIHRSMRYAGNEELTYEDVMALSGFAFQLHINRFLADDTGSCVYDLDTMVTNGLLNLGLHNRFIGGFIGEPHTPKDESELNFIMEMIHSSIGKGFPVIVNNDNLFVDEFVLVYGYDDERQLLYAQDARREVTIPYAAFGRTAPYYVHAIDGAFEIGKTAALYRTLRLAILHARGGEATFHEYTNGLAAYDVWIALLEQESVEARSNAEYMSIIREARGSAAAYLQNAATGLMGQGYEKCSKSALKAAEHYAEVEAAFAKLCILFPLPDGVELSAPERKADALQLLHEARMSEERGIAELENLLQMLDDHGIEKSIKIPIELPPHPYFLFGTEHVDSGQPGPAVYETEAVYVYVRNMKRSIAFYTGLIGLEVPNGLEDGPCFIIQLAEGVKLVLLDPRIDLEQARFQLRSSNYPGSLDKLTELGFEMTMKPDAGLHMRFLTFREPGGATILLSDQPLCYPSASVIPDVSPVKPRIDAIYLETAQTGRTKEAFCGLLGDERKKEELTRNNELSITLLPGVEFRAAGNPFGDRFAAFRMNAEHLEDAKMLVPRIGGTLLDRTAVPAEEGDYFDFLDPDGTVIRISRK